MADSEATLYAIPGSHPCMTAELMLRHKGIAFRRHNLVAGMHPIGVRLRGFPGGKERELNGARRTASLFFADRMGTVPAVRFADGERVQTNLCGA